MDNLRISSYDLSYSALGFLLFRVTQSTIVYIKKVGCILKYVAIITRQIAYDFSALLLIIPDTYFKHCSNNMFVLDLETGIEGK